MLTPRSPFSPAAGQGCSAQADKGSLRPQIHQQGSLRQTESRLKYYPGEKAARRGPSQPSKSPAAPRVAGTHPRLCSHPVSSHPRRSITLSSSTCAMPSKTTKTAFSCLTLCLGATSDVSALGVELSSSSKRFHLISFLVHLERLGRLSEEAVQLYTAELSSALSYLHEKRIIHRCVYSRFLFSSNSRLSHFGCI